MCSYWCIKELEIGVFKFSFRSDHDLQWFLLTSSFIHTYVLVFKHTQQVQNHKKWLSVYRKNYLKRGKNLILFSVSVHKFDDQFLLRSDAIFLIYFSAAIFDLVQCCIFMGLKEFVSIGVSFRTYVLLNLLSSKLRARAFEWRCWLCYPYDWCAYVSVEPIRLTKKFHNERILWDRHRRHFDLVGRIVFVCS